jgi:hypothetical protein
MSNISSAGGFKPPMGITGRNDGGGPGSGNFYGGPPMPYEEEEDEEQDEVLETDPNANPFEQLTYVSPNLSLKPGLMTPVKALAASVHYQKYLSDVVPDETALEAQDQSGLE